MAENNELLKCPLCQGQGQVHRFEIVERLSDKDLQARIEGYAAEMAKPEPAGVKAGSSPARDFQKEVHGWNPQLPMWRRSNKE
jgi:hypothetical protein